MSVVIETTVGDLTVDLFTDERPLACLNFIKLCKLKYYNYNLFHTIEQDFIAQTGDPTGAGDGGSSVWGVIEGPQKRFFEAESLPKLLHTSVGLLSLVSPGKHLVGSQFFFTLGADLTSLDGQHCVIGAVVEGHDTLRNLNEAIVDDKYRPYQDIRITHTVILEDPFPDMRGFRAPSRSPSPTAERLQNGRIAADEDIDDTEGKSMEEIHEILAEREAKARATILEIVGDLPDAETAPPENVLFVCKLNPVTTEDDLEIIFSRFGKVVSCEVIRDKKSGDSLQYAFVEFDNEKACEAAYFKMNNVLIDDRRIHVDFSQSVARVKWRGKGRGVEGTQGRLDFRNLRETEINPKSNNEERRKAREMRHRERDDNDQKRSRGRSPPRNRETGTYDRKRYETKESQIRYDQSRERNDYGRRIQSSRDNSSRSKNYKARAEDRKRIQGTPDKMRREDSPDMKRRQEALNKKRREESSDMKRKLETSNKKREAIPDKEHIQDTTNKKRRSKTPDRKQDQKTSGRRRKEETPDGKRRPETLDKKQRQPSLDKRRQQETADIIHREDRQRRQETSDRKNKEETIVSRRRQETPDKRRRQDTPRSKRREESPDIMKKSFDRRRTDSRECLKDRKQEQHRDDSEKKSFRDGHKSFQRDNYNRRERCENLELSKDRNREKKRITERSRSRNGNTQKRSMSK